LPPVGGDPVLALPRGGGLVALSRRDGRITVFNARWRVRRIIELGAAAAAEDIAVDASPLPVDGLPTDLVVLRR
ncbi:MAG: hypothetical protein ACRERC_27450, partial [Candidatus Binatia bacterium]